MKMVKFILVTGYVIFNIATTAKADQQMILQLDESAAIFAEVSSSNRYNKLEVVINGESYQICRYGTYLDSMICQDPKKPYMHASSTVGEKTFWGKTKMGVEIDKDLNYKMTSCYNNVVYSSFGCYEQPY